MDSTTSHDAGTMNGGRVSDSRLRTPLTLLRAVMARGPSSISSQLSFVISIVARLKEVEVSHETQSRKLIWKP